MASYVTQMASSSSFSDSNADHYNFVFVPLLLNVFVLQGPSRAHEQTEMLSLGQVIIQIVKGCREAPWGHPTTYQEGSSAIWGM